MSPNLKSCVAVDGGDPTRGEVQLLRVEARLQLLELQFLPVLGLHRPELQAADHRHGPCVCEPSCLVGEVQIQPGLCLYLPVRSHGTSPLPRHQPQLGHRGVRMQGPVRRHLVPIQEECSWECEAGGYSAYTWLCDTWEESWRYSWVGAGSLLDRTQEGRGEKH